MRKTVQIIIISIIILAGISVFILLTRHKLTPQKTLIKKTVPLVKVIRARGVSYQMIVKGYGEVKPVSTGYIVSQIKGKVVYISPNLKKGKVIKKGELLIKIEDVDYKIGLSRAIANLKQTNATLIKTEEESKQAIYEWNIDHKKEKIPPLAAKIPQLEAAKGTYKAAQAEVLEARLNLERTNIIAPYSAVVLQRQVDIGSVVSFGQTLAQIYPISEVEVYIPLSLSDINWIDVPGFNLPFTERGSKTHVEYYIGDQKIHFVGEIVRSIGEIDKNTRQLYVVASIKNPFSKIPPLLLNTFVTTKIEGKILKKAYVIPMEAIFNDEFVLKVINNRIKPKKVKIVKMLKDSVIVTDGIKDNDKIVITPMSGNVEGIEVKIVN